MRFTKAPSTEGALSLFGKPLHENIKSPYRGFYVCGLQYIILERLYARSPTTDGDFEGL